MSLSFKEVVAEIMRNEKLNTRQFEIKCGFGNDSVKNMGDNSRKYTKEKICAAFPNIRREFIFDGEQPMYKEASDVSTSRIKELEQENLHLKAMIASKDESLALKDQIINLLKSK